MASKYSYKIGKKPSTKSFCLNNTTLTKRLKEMGAISYESDWFRRRSFKKMQERKRGNQT